MAIRLNWILTRGWRAMSINDRKSSARIATKLIRDRSTNSMAYDYIATLHHSVHREVMIPRVSAINPSHDNEKYPLSSRWIINSIRVARTRYSTLTDNLHFDSVCVFHIYSMYYNLQILCQLSRVCLLSFFIINEDVFSIYGIV